MAMILWSSIVWLLVLFHCQFIGNAEWNAKAPRVCNDVIRDTHLSVCLSCGLAFILLANSASQIHLDFCWRGPTAPDQLKILRSAPTNSRGYWTWLFTFFKLYSYFWAYKPVQNWVIFFSCYFYYLALFFLYIIRFFLIFFLQIHLFKMNNLIV